MNILWLLTCVHLLSLLEGLKLIFYLIPNHLYKISFKHVAMCLPNHTVRSLIHLNMNYSHLINYINSKSTIGSLSNITCM